MPQQLQREINVDQRPEHRVVRVSSYQIVALCAIKGQISLKLPKIIAVTLHDRFAIRVWVKNARAYNQVFVVGADWKLG